VLQGGEIAARGPNREGAVFRQMIGMADEFQGRVSFKVFNPKFGGRPHPAYVNP
jgi:hypothetical protein